MFDLGFSELMVIALVALVVLGPERLPKAARFAGLWVRRARAQWYSVKSELERELAAEELKRNLDAARTAATDLERDLRGAADELGREARAAAERAREGVTALRDDIVAGAPSADGGDGGDGEDAPAAPPGPGPGPGPRDGGPR